MSDRLRGPALRLIETRLGQILCLAWVAALAATLAW